MPGPARSTRSTARTAAPPVPQWLRVPGFTVPTVTLALLAHLAAGGAPPGFAMLALLYGSVGLLCASVAPRERRLPQLLAGVGLVQVGVHVALLEHHSTVAPARSSTSGVMTAAHLAATLALAWWLRRGEAMLWRAAARALRSLFRVLAPPGSSITVGPTTPARRAPRSHGTLLLAVRIPRGPPARS
jgi:hypothetical protein